MQTPLLIKKNFSFVAALYREYIEELFDGSGFEAATGDDDLKRLYKNDHIKELRSKINKLYFFEFLGVSFDMISLRPMFSFLLRIDDPSFLEDNNFKRNHENRDLRFISIKDLEQYVIERQEGMLAASDRKTADRAPFMAESAGVYHLMKGNHLFMEAMAKIQRNG